MALDAFANLFFSSSLSKPFQLDFSHFMGDIYMDALINNINNKYLIIVKCIMSIY